MSDQKPTRPTAADILKSVEEMAAEQTRAVEASFEQGGVDLERLTRSLPCLDGGKETGHASPSDAQFSLGFDFEYGSPSEVSPSNLASDYKKEIAEHKARQAEEKRLERDLERRAIVDRGPHEKEPARGWEVGAYGVTLYRKGDPLSVVDEQKVSVHNRSDPSLNGGLDDCVTKEALSPRPDIGIRYQANFYGLNPFKK